MSDPTSSPSGPPRPIEIYLDGAATPYKTVAGPPYRLGLDTTTLRNGEHTLRIVQTDEAGVRQEQTYTFLVDNKTTFAVSGMEPGGRVAGTVELDIEPQRSTAAGAPAHGDALPLPGPNPWWYIGVTMVVFLAIWMFFLLVPTYSAWVSGGGSEGAAGVDANMMAVGESLYATNCAACHVQEGTGMGTAIPALAGNVALKDTEMTLSTIAHGAGTMMAFSTLDAQQLASVATYVRNAWGNDYGAVTTEEASAVLSSGAPTAPSAADQAEAAPTEAEAAPAPAQAEPAPAEAAPAQAEPAPAETTPAQAEPAPAETTPAQAEPAPAETTPAQAEPAPAETTPAQAEPAPAETTPAQAEPAPAETAPAQAEPAPAETTPAQAEAAPAAASGETRVVTSEAPLTGQDDTALATLNLGAKVSVAADQGDSAQAVVDGWSMEGAASVIFLNSDQRIVLAALTDAGQQAREVLDSKTDDYGTNWQQVKLSGTVPSTDLSADASALWADGEALYSSSCSACHALHSPDQFTANQWPGSLKSMLPMVSLSDEQLELMTKYLQYHAKDM